MAMFTRRFATSGATVEDDSRTITFLANSGKPMLDGYSVDLDSLNVTTRSGAVVKTNALEDPSDIDVPLLTDHMPSIMSQAGRVSELTRDDKGLHVKARLATTDAGNTVYTLAKEGMLGGSFSITILFPEEPGDDLVIHNALLTEISVVYKGNDPTAVFESSNKIGDKIMSVAELMKKFGLSEDQAKKIKDALTAAGSAVDDATDKTDDTDKTGDDSGKADDPDIVAQNETKEDEGKSENMAQHKASNGVNDKGTIVLVNQTVKNGGKKSSWLDSHDAVATYEQFLIDNPHGKNANDVFKMQLKRKWAGVVKNKLNDHAESFDISPDDVDKLIPTPVITAIEDAYNNASEIWPLFKKLGVDHFPVGYNDVDLNQADGKGRGHGYPRSKYGTQKQAEDIKLKTRELGAQMVYKYIPIPEGFVRETGGKNGKGGVMIDYVLSELPNRLMATNEYASLMGGYKDAAGEGGTDEFPKFLSVVDDAKDATNNYFANTTTAVAADPVLKTIQIASGNVRAAGPRYLITNRKNLVDMMWSADSTGRPFMGIPAGSLADALGLSGIITPEWWGATEDAKAMGIVLVPSAYGITGDTSPSAYYDFVIDTNTNQYMTEMFIGGGLIKKDSASVILPKA